MSVRLSDIQHEVAARFHLLPKEITEPTRCHIVLHPRQLACLLSRELTDKSLPQIARHFGMKDHTTVINAISRVNQRIRQHPAWLRHYNTLKERLS